MAKRKKTSTKAKAVKKTSPKKAKEKDPKKAEEKDPITPVVLKLDRDNVQQVFVKPKYNYLKAQGVK
tara:strand:- start:2750 stop:2950 length:201 start_codon:yes stop_codon:yes gene_type:complete